MIWNIISYVGAGSLLFNMSANDVEKLLGAPRRVNHVFGVRREYRAFEEYPMLNYDGVGLSSITFSPDCKHVNFHGMSVFEEHSHAMLDKMIALDPGMFGNYTDTMVSVKFGVSFGGFVYRNDANKSFGCFRRGVWDENLSRMTTLPPPPASWPEED